VLVEVLVAAGVKKVHGLAGDSLNGSTDSIRTRENAISKTALPRRWGCPVVLVSFLTASAAVGNDLAPPAPEKPWSPPGLNAYERALAQGGFSNQPNAAQI